MSAAADYLRNPDPGPDAPDAGTGIWEGIKGLKRLARAKVLREAPDIAATFLTGMAGQAAGGWQGLTKLATGQGLDAAVKAIEDTQRQVTYTPREEGGQEGVQAIGEAIEPIGKWAKETFADPAGERWPAIGAALVTAPEILPGPKGIKNAVGGAGKAAKAAKGAERGVEAAEAAAAPVEAIAKPAAAAVADPTSDPAGAATQAALRVIRIADDSGINIGDRNAAFERARLAARGRLDMGGTFDDAQAAAHHITFSRPEAATPYSIDAPTGHERLTARIAADRAARGGEPLPATPHPTEVAEQAMREFASTPNGDDLRPLVLRTVRNALNQGASVDQAVSEARAAGWQQVVAQRQGERPQPASVQAALREPIVDVPEASPAGLLVRLQEARDADAAWRDNPSTENATRRRVAIAELQRGDEPTPDTPLPGSTEAIQRERMRAAALRGENTMAGFAAAADAPGIERGAGVFAGEDWIPPGQLQAALREEPDTSAALDAAQRAYDADQNPATEQALRGAIDAFVQREGTLPPYGTQFESRTLTPAQETRLREVDPGGWLDEQLNVSDADSRAETLDARARVLTRRLLGSVNEYDTEFLNVRDDIRHRLETAAGRGHGVFAGEDWIPERPVTRPAGGYDPTTRQASLRHQKELPGAARRVDPQLPLSGIKPLSEIRQRVLRRGDPGMNRESVMAFYEAGRDNPEMFQYGVDPVRTGEVGRYASLEDYADVYGQRAGERIGVSRSGGASANFDFDVEIEPEPLRHGYGEVMRDRQGDIIEEKKTHDPGDRPVYDAQGRVIKVEGPMEHTGEPTRRPYTAVGGELVREPRDQWGGGGDPRYRETLSGGGEVMRDEHGDIKTDATHDEEAYYERVREAEQEAREEWERNNSGGDEEVALRTRKGGNLDVTIPKAGEWEVGAGSNARGKDASGAVLYQMLLNQASHAGAQIGGGNLTDINALRVLSNANTNFARTGINPRGLRGTASGDLPTPYADSQWGDRAHEEYAEGPEIWRSESDEALKRAPVGGGKPERLSFDPEEGFLLDGVPSPASRIAAAFPEMSPNVKFSGVGLKTLMRSAVFDWLRDATPEEAAKVAKTWSKKYGPLFGVAPIGLAMQDEEGRGFTVQDALREKAEEKTR